MARSRASRPLGFGVGAVVAGLAAVLGAGALADNSFLTHLATGRLILDGDLPRSDPYTFTAAGEQWVVQSWLASTMYAAAEKLGGLGAVRLLVAATTAGLGALTWTLTAAAGAGIGRALVFAPAFMAGFGAWSERPLLFGLAGLGMVLLAAEGRLDPRWLVPVGWCWVNAHGSWPLGLVAVICMAAGRRLDGTNPQVELRAGVWLGAGFIAAVANPYGPRLLVFPAHLLSRRDALAEIVEWGPMTFDDIGQWAFLGLVVIGVIGLQRSPSWRATVPLLVFACAALTGLRNVPVATLVLLPGAARGMCALGSIRFDQPSRLTRPLIVASVGLVLLAVLSIGRTDDVGDKPYPVAAERWLREHGLDPASERVIAREFVGNWLEERNGATGTVFIDDRAEVIPLAVVRDHGALLDGDPSWESVLERYDPAAVLWQADRPLASLLAADEDWEIPYRDEDWVVAVPIRDG